MRTLFYDLRFSLRQLRKTPGTALIAIMMLALGVGANAAIFTVVESVLLRPLPYAHSGRLIYIGPADEKTGFWNTSWLNLHDIQTESKLLADAAGYSQDVAVLENEDGSQTVVAPRLTVNLFAMLGARPLLGRTFSKAEGETGGPQAVLLSEGLWRQTFHAAPDIVGRVVRIGGKQFSVVGVMPASFHFPESAGADLQKGIWLPLQPTHEMLTDRGFSFFTILGELRPGVTAQEAQQELNAIAAHFPREAGDSPIAFRCASYQDTLTGPVRPVLYALLGALALVLLIACANVSNLLIARCLGRQQEFAIRAALGAGRARLIRQMLIEGFTLSLIGCGLGALLAQGAMLALHKLPDGTIPRADSIAIHWTILLMLAAIAFAVTLLSSILPALLVARANPQRALQTASRGVGTRSVSGRLSGALVAGEVALSTVLLIGTGLLFHTLWNLEKSHLGFETAHLTTFTAMPADAAGFASIGVPHDADPAPASVATLTYQPVLERIRQMPGVRSAALATAPPLAGNDMHTSFTVLGRPRDPARRPEARITAVSGGYARTLGTPIIQGRTISDSDGPDSPFVVVVNQALVKKYFSGQYPIGKQIDLGGKDTGMLKPYTIVGVLGDQVDQAVGREPQPLLLLSQQQIPTTSLFYPALLRIMVTFVVRTGGNVPIAPEMRTVFHELAPGYALDSFQTMQEQVDQSIFSRRLGLYLVGAFAGLAVVMVIAGLYGVLSQLVGYRRREIGVRMALGATRQSVAAMILRQGSILIGAGLAVGIGLALAAGHLLTSFLYGVRPLDAWTYIGVVAALAVIGLGSAMLPARRAARIEPMQALRED